MNPVAEALSRVLVPALVKRVSNEVGQQLPPTVTHELHREVERVIERDPTLKNELNQESPIQSRVAWGAVIAALGVLVPMIARLFGYDVSEDDILRIGGAVATLFGAAYVLYGRFATFSAPLFERWRR